MPSSREYPERPLVGVGGVVIEGERALLIRRASEPLRGEWSIPGGMLELGETLQAGVARELLEETGLHVRVLDLIEVFERIVYARDSASVRDTDAGVRLTDYASGPAVQGVRPRFHFVIADYLCERISGEHAAASDVTDLEFARENDLARFHLTETALRILHKAFAMHRARRSA
jgi:ADP-ribose pyrophosphatase YjhB (NUDIX family)